jgi:hypothetical protein
MTPSAPCHPPRRLSLHRVGLLACLLALIVPAPTATAAVPAAPAWTVAVSSYPTNFVPGTTGTDGGAPGYLVVATNIGGAPTSGQFEISNTLPAGLEFVLAKGAGGRYGAAKAPLACEVVLQTVTCSATSPGLNPGETIALNIPVKVPAGEGAAVDEASVEGGGAPPSVATTETAITSQVPAFGFLPGPEGISGAITGADGLAATQAGSHPYQVRSSLRFPVQSSGPFKELQAIGGGLKDIAVDLPQGLIVDPRATPVRCTEVQLEQRPAGCPAESQVGTLAVALSVGQAPNMPSLALYNMVPPAGTAIEFGAELQEGLPVHLLGNLRSGGDYGMSAEIRDISAKLPILGADLTLWGNPSDASHDYVRGRCLALGGTCPVQRTDAAFLTLPTGCGGPLTTVTRADSWLEPGVSHERGFESPAIDGCNRPGFVPTLIALPTTGLADSPTGVDFDLHLAQSNSFSQLANSSLRKIRITLPDGMTANPAGADGLQGCPPSAVGLLTSPNQQPAHFTALPAQCPDAAKVGSLEVDTPLLDRPLPGSIYLAQPFDNPFGSLFAIYLTVHDPRSGIVVKLAGEVEPDPSSGRLTATFADNPELPIEEFRAHFFVGPRAIFKTPAFCGTYATSADLTPWSTPEGVDVTRSDTFAIATGPSGGDRCSASEGTAPNRPRFSAGSIAPTAGRYRPFLLRLDRDDGTQRFARLDAKLPAGLSGRLTGVPFCAEAQIATRSCPASSEVGTVDIAAGVGISPLHLRGRVYMAGPYGGAPLSLATVTPALAGPFDLGTVVVRVAVFVDRRSGQVHAVSDPLPTILSGVPLEIRSLALELDRPGFTLNPTSCDPMFVVGSAGSTAGQDIPLADRFQVGECSRLGFRPAVSLRFSGPTRRGAHPSFRTVLTPRHGDANIRRVAVTLPGTELLDNRHIGAICTMPRYAAERCPPASVYGYAKAWTPLLERPLQGPVYLRASNHRLPDLAASLNGQVHLDLIGRIDSVDGRLRNTFQGLPDAPLSRVVVTMRGGRRGLLVNSGHFCARRPRAGVAFLAQNGKVRELDPLARGDCGSPAERALRAR